MSVPHPAKIVADNDGVILPSPPSGSTESPAVDLELIGEYPISADAIAIWREIFNSVSPSERERLTTLFKGA